MPPLRAATPARGGLFALAAILFVSYFCVALSLPTTPVFVGRSLGLGTFWAGLAVGIAFLATVVSRAPAGGIADRRGPKVALRAGLVLYVCGAALSALAGLSDASAAASFLLLGVSRILLGVGQSLVSVGVITWGIKLVGQAQSGKVLAVIGAVTYGALAIGGPIGLEIFKRIGFAGTMGLSALPPCLGLMALGRIPDVAVDGTSERTAFGAVIRQVWIYGSIICLQGIGFAAIGAFFALYFAARNWDGGGLGLSAFGGGFVLVRLLAGNMPDRFGGLPVAIGSLTVEMSGQLLIAVTHDQALTLFGAFMTGLGSSLMFPSIGREVVRITSPAQRGAALGTFSAFQDLSYGLTGPLGGLLVERSDYPSVFLAGGIAAAVGLIGATFCARRGAETRA